MRFNLFVVYRAVQTFTKKRRSIYSVISALLAGFITVGIMLALPAINRADQASTPQEPKPFKVDLAKPPPPPPPEFEPPIQSSKADIEYTITPPDLKQAHKQLELETIQLSLDIGVPQSPTGVLAIPDFSLKGSPNLGIQSFELSQLDEVPTAIKQVAPNYPRKLYEKKISGKVVLFFTVDEHGRVQDIRIDSSTHRKFQQEAIKAVKQWRFTPGKKDGRVVRTTQFRLPLIFERQ